MFGSMFTLKQIGFWLVAAAAGLVLLFVFTYFAVSLAIYSTVENWMTSRLGLDYYAAQLMTTVVLVGLTVIAPTIVVYLIFGRWRISGALGLIGIQAGIFILVYSVGGSVCFDRRTGKPLCYFADTERGRVWSYTLGFDPVSGKQLQLYTRETVKKDSAKR